MTVLQSFYTLAGLIATLFVAGLGFAKYYVASKFEGVKNQIDSVKSQVDTLVQYMVSHEGRIATLEERTKKL